MIWKRGILALLVSMPGLILAGGGAARAATTASFECLPACTAEVGSTLTFRSTSIGDGGIRSTDWDLDDDGAYDDATGPSATKAFPTAGSFVVGVQVTDGTAAVVRATRTVVIRGAGPLPFAAPAADTDGDGVGGAADRCPRSVGKGRAYAGCTAADLVIDPAAVAGPVLDALGHVRQGKVKLAHVKPILGLLRKGTLAITRQPSRTCSGAELLADADDLADEGVDLMRDRLLLDTVKLLVKEARKGRGRDADSVDVRLAGWNGLAADVEEVADDVGALARAVERACRAGKGRKQFQGRVVEVDAAGLTARLADGRTVALARADGVPVVPGLQVEGTGFQVGPAQGGVLVATEVGAEVGTLVPIPCTATPRFAPVQDFNVGAAKIFYLDRRGYLFGDRYHVEHGMGIGATTSCPNSDHRLELTLTYKNTLNKKVKKLIGNLYADPAVDYPAILPDDIRKGSATLHGELWDYDCQLFGDVVSCDKGALADSWDVKLDVRPQGGWARVAYASGVLYSVEDAQPADFDVATLGPATMRGDPQGFQPGISFAIGYGLVNGTTTYPTTAYVVQGQPFALHQDLPALDPTAYDGGYGVPGGVITAYVDGTRNGYQAQYVAVRPNIVTDLIAECALGVDTFYRLPWKGGTQEKTTQGNNTEFTHNGDGAYAFDFRLGDIGDSIRAARGGVVESVEEKYTQNSNPKVLKLLKQIDPEVAKLYWKPANTLTIRHQDGNASVYAHMPKNGVLVEEGDVVVPGEKVAIVGNTGNSTDPHLHFEVDDGAASIPISFEIGGSPPLPCVVPFKGLSMTSSS